MASDASNSESEDRREGQKQLDEISELDYQDGGSDHNDKENGENESSDKESSDKEFSDTNDRETPLIDFFSEFCKGDKEEILVQKLDELGVETLSDLEHLNFRESFNDIFKPVQISKLEKKFKEIGKTNGESKRNAELFDFNKILSRNQLNMLEGSKKLAHFEVINITQEIGDHMFYNISSTASKKLCKRVAESLLMKYKNSLDGRGMSKGLSVVSLGQRIRNRVRYRKKLQKKANKPSTLTNALNLCNFTKSQCHGFRKEQDLPLAFPDGETSEIQENKRKQIVKMNETGEVNWKSVKQLMNETYVAQRITINCLKSMESILKEWPYIGKFSYLKSHFSKLTELDMDTVEGKWNELFLSIIKYLTAEANNKAKRGTVAEIAKSIRHVLKQYEAVADKTCSDQFMAVVLGLAAKLEIDSSLLILNFPDTASFDDVQASKKLPKDGKPLVAVLGDDYFEDPKCFVLVDNRIISPVAVNPMKGILAVFMSYFVFKISYSKKLQPLMNFFERDMFGIKSIEGSTRTERLKKPNGVWECAAKSLAPKYLSLMEQIDDYLDMW